MQPTASPPRVSIPVEIIRRILSYPARRAARLAALAEAARKSRLIETENRQ